MIVLYWYWYLQSTEGNKEHTRIRDFFNAIHVSLKIIGEGRRKGCICTSHIRVAN
jgi:hypothetical protein